MPSWSVWTTFASSISRRYAEPLITSTTMPTNSVTDGKQNHVLLLHIFIHCFDLFHFFNSKHRRVQQGLRRHSPRLSRSRVHPGTDDPGQVKPDSLGIYLRSRLRLVHLYLSILSSSQIYQVDSSTKKGWTNDQIVDDVRHLSAGLQATEGLTKGQFIGLALPNCAEFIVSALAVMRCGGVVAMVNPAYTISITSSG